MNLRVIWLSGVRDAVYQRYLGITTSTYHYSKYDQRLSAWARGRIDFGNSAITPQFPGTEDLVHCLHAMGYEAGIDLAGLIEVSKGVQEIIGRELPGQVMKAGQWNRRYRVPHTVEERLAALAS